MDAIKDLWPILQTGGAAAALLCIIALREMKKDRDAAVTKYDRAMERFVELSNSAVVVIERNAANTAVQSELIRRALDQGSKVA